MTVISLLKLLDTDKQCAVTTKAYFIIINIPSVSDIQDAFVHLALSVPAHLCLYAT